MAVEITDSCINCGACIDECPVEAIVDDEENPTNNEIYYVFADKCVECVEHHDSPACAAACPTDGCIVWSDVVSGMPSNDNRGAKGSAVVQ